MAVRMSVVWAVRLSFAVALVSLQAFGDSGDPLFGDTFSGPPAAPFSWTPISGAPCFRTMDANANPVMQCDSNSSIVVSGGGSATWDNYYVHVAPNQSHFIRVYGRWQNVNNYYVFEYDPTGVNQFPVTLSAVVGGVRNDLAYYPDISVTTGVVFVFDKTFISAYVYWNGVWIRIIAVHDGSFSSGSAGFGNGGFNDGAQFSNFFVADANGGVDFEPYECWGGPPPLTSQQNYGSCGTVCSGMSTGWDAINHNSDDVVVRGTVGAGACYDRKNLRAVEGEPSTFPHIAGDDDEFNHNDRDFEFRIMPTDGRFVGLANSVGRNRWEGAAAGDMLVEIPSMYMYPTLDSNRWANSVAPFAFPFYPSGMPLTNDGEHLGIPWSGDEVVVQGRAIWDCGHCDSGYNRSEIHPPDAVAWLHPVRDVPRTGIVWLRALSRRAYPGDQIGATDLLRASGHQFIATLNVPGGASAEDIYIGPVQSDFLVDSQLQHSGVCQTDPGTNFKHPWGCISTACQSVNFYLCPPPADLIAAEKALSFSGYFSVDPSGSGSSGSTTVQIQALRDNGSTELPYIMGAHYKVCIPECVGGVNQNGCPVACKPPAPPMNLMLVSASSSVVSLSWSASSGPISPLGYYVYRSTTSGSNYTRLTSTTATSWSDTSVTPGTTFFYAVSAWNGGGAAPVNESARSNEVSVAVPAICDATSCPNGCCSGNTCQVGISPATGCKTGGVACAAACTAGYVCSNNSCTYQCNATTCSQGCCSGNVCEPGNSTAYGCVANGGACAASCAPGYFCSGGMCSCTPTTCAAQGKNCGSLADGCGGTLSCGTCSAPQTCGGGGVANVCGCQPISSCGNQCGNIPDGCGGTINCGCAGGMRCLSGFCGCPAGTQWCDPGCFAHCV